MRILNLGILAHVDAGKTSLTERLLFESGVIPKLGSVDKCNTQTDSLVLERQRGITIKSAVVSFTLDDLKVNLVDTPGHPDFIAEVERALSILDAVIFVISAVEGIQSQTKILMRTLKKLHLPTLLFINKIDRVGANDSELVADIRTKLFSNVLNLNTVTNIGSSSATVTPIPNFIFSDVHLLQQITNMEVCPLFFGSAITGAGISALMQSLGTLVFPHGQKINQTLSALVFKIMRTPKDKNIAYLRLFSGTIQVGQHITVTRFQGVKEQKTFSQKINSLSLFQNGRIIESQMAFAGDIIKVSRLSDVLIGDWIGVPAKNTLSYFPPPTLEAIISPLKETDRTALYMALKKLSEEDPLIQFSQNNQKIFVLLYGEIQKEVIQDTLQSEYGLRIYFETIDVLYVEKPNGIGTAYADKTDADNFFEATLGLKIVPAPANSGIIFKPGPGTGGLPKAFIKAVEEAIYATLKQGLYGWQVTDCIIEVTDVGYWDALSNIGDFRGLTPLLIMEALQKAGTNVYEPFNDYQIEVPEPLLGLTIQKLTAAKATINDIIQLEHGNMQVNGAIPVLNTYEFKSSIPEITQGEGSFTTKLSEYYKVQSKPPVKNRTGFNPLNKQEYMRHILRGD